MEKNQQEPRDVAPAKRSKTRRCLSKQVNAQWRRPVRAAMSRITAGSGHCLRICGQKALHCLVRRRATHHMGEEMPSSPPLNPSTLRGNLPADPSTTRPVLKPTVVNPVDDVVCPQPLVLPRTERTREERSISLAMPCPWDCSMSSRFMKNSECPE